MTSIKTQLANLQARYGAKTWRTLKAARCPHCRAFILTGLDDDMCAMAVTVNPEPITAKGEAIAVLVGLPTYHLKRAGAGTAITRRSRWNRRSHPVGMRGLDVVAEHTCTPIILPTTDSQFQPPAAPTGDDQCPF